MPLKPRQLMLLALIASSSLLTLPVVAATKVASESGFSGYVGIGASSLQVKSNLVAGDVGNDQIDDLGDSPSSQSSSGLNPDLSLTYTFDNLNTEVFLGNSVEDFIRFDFNTAIGLRHQVADTGVFEVVVLRTPSPTEIWSDPYATGVDRDETDRVAHGIRLEWGAIMGSGFDLRLTRRANEVDDENSGATLVAANVISASEQQLLERDGDLETATVIYNWDFGRGQALALTGNYIRHDLDGDAMSLDGYSVQLTSFNALAPKVRLATNLLLGRFDHDDENPVFGKTNDKDLVAVTLSLFVSDIFGAKGWIGNATVAYADEDNAIDFFDTTASLAAIGLLYRF